MFKKVLIFPRGILRSVDLTQYSIVYNLLTPKKSIVTAKKRYYTDTIMNTFTKLKCVSPSCCDVHY